MSAVLEQVFQVGFLAAIIRIATPLAFATLGEMFSERAGVLNLGIEGIMVAGAFSVAGGVAANNIASWDPVSGVWSPLGLGTNSPVLTLAAAALTTSGVSRFSAPRSSASPQRPQLLVPICCSFVG